MMILSRTDVKLLIVTQAVDQHDPTLGFFHRWIEEFARHCEKVYVICLFEGTHSLPANVRVLSLGKEYKHSRAQYLYRFFKYLWKYRREYDSVFVHMNQIYVILGGFLWRLWRKRVSLWYTHGAVSILLHLAEWMSHAIITASPESFRLASEKTHIVGHGIDTKYFTRCPQTYRPGVIRILSVGRISPVKRCEVLVEAARLLREKGEKFSVTFVGDTDSAGAYYNTLKEHIRAHGLEAPITFTGGVSHERVAGYLCQSDIFVNSSETGSLDKAGLEAIAAGVPLLTSNEAYQGVLGTYRDRLMFPKGDVSVLVEHILALHRSDDRQEIVDTLAAKVRKEHSLEMFIPRILDVIAG